MVVGAKVYELTDGFLWLIYGLYVGILASPLMKWIHCQLHTVSIMLAVALL